MGQSYEDIYQEFCEVLLGDYRTEPEHQEAVIKATASAVKLILEKLRDAEPFK